MNHPKKSYLLGDEINFLLWPILWLNLLFCLALYVIKDIKILMSLGSRLEKRGCMSDFGMAGLWLHQQRINYMVQCRPKVRKVLISITCISPLDNGMWIQFTKKGDWVVCLWNILKTTWVWGYILLDNSQMVAGICDTRQEKWCCSSPKEKRFLGFLCPIQYCSASTHRD